MARRRHIRVKMRNSLHGAVIAIPRNVSKLQAADILKEELQRRTPIDTSNALIHWYVRQLANGDMRVINEVVYIRRLMIDGYSPQSAAGAYLRAILAARARILQLGLDNA